MRVRYILLYQDITVYYILLHIATKGVNLATSVKGLSPKMKIKKHFGEEEKEWSAARLENTNKQMSYPGVRNMDHVSNVEFTD